MLFAVTIQYPIFIPLYVVGMFGSVFAVGCLVKLGSEPATTGLRVHSKMPKSIDDRG